jgi:cyanate lyase
LIDTVCLSGSVEIGIDPLIYRFYEIMQVYGMALKEVIFNSGDESLVFISVVPPLNAEYQLVAT